MKYKLRFAFVASTILRILKITWHHKLQILLGMILATTVYVIFKHDPERMSRYSFLPSSFPFYNSLYFPGKLTIHYISLVN